MIAIGYNIKMYINVYHFHHVISYLVLIHICVCYIHIDVHKLMVNIVKKYNILIKNKNVHKLQIIQIVI